MENKENLTKELEKLIREFRSYKRLLKLKSLTKVQEGYMYSLRSKLQREIGTYGDLIIGLTGKRWASELSYRFDFWVEALRADGLKSRTLNSIETCIQTINEAIGKLNSTPLVELGEEKTQSPIELFNVMHFHTLIIKVTKPLYANGHYAQAIFEAFKAVENFVKKKSGSNLYGKQLMATVFNEEKPIIQVPEAGFFDKDVQEGFKFLFMGASQGIRNPKAHNEVIQNDPYITLEYLGFASFLLKRIDYWETGKGIGE
jgi:uncharacterized protein (TIGR02391 family)